MPGVGHARVLARAAARTLAHLSRCVDPGETTISEEDDQGVRHRVFCDTPVAGGRCVLPPDHNTGCTARGRW
ncbi:MAG TPA: hypothetical protein VGD43_21935 [Micromonospora sp.]